MNILFLLWLLMALCPLPCGRSFARSQDLKTHQSICKIFLEARRISDAAAIQGQSAKDVYLRKRQRQRSPSPEVVPASSTSNEVNASNIELILCAQYHVSARRFSHGRRHCASHGTSPSPNSTTSHPHGQRSTDSTEAQDMEVTSAASCSSASACPRSGASR
jgi:hypothetical protein